jgi:formylglycine-generating enzyme required for sulfatase activity
MKIRAVILLSALILVSGCTEKRSQEEAPKSQDKLTDMVQIPAGEFIMGSNIGSEDERPERKVSLNSFYIDIYAVTNKKYKDFIDTTGHQSPKSWLFKGYVQELNEHPVVFVDFEDATAYCAWLEKRLPTEEDWEKAARGTDGRIYPWGNEFNLNNANTGLLPETRTVPVNANKDGKSPFGTYNMSGNVWEWTTTIGQNEGRRVVKGGSFGISHRFSRTFSRVDYSKKDKTNNIGFRCAL